MSSLKFLSDRIVKRMRALSETFQAQVGGLGTSLRQHCLLFVRFETFFIKRVLRFAYTVRELHLHLTLFDEFSLIAC